MEIPIKMPTFIQKFISNPFKNHDNLLRKLKEIPMEIPIKMPTFIQKFISNPFKNRDNLLRKLKEIPMEIPKKCRHLSRNLLVIH